MRGSFPGGDGPRDPNVLLGLAVIVAVDLAALFLAAAFVRWLTH